MDNPYLNRTAIRDAEAFIGRSSELRRLFNRIGGSQPQSVSIVGDRRVGKSSLLRALIAKRHRSLARPDSYVFVYLDMQSRLRWTAEMFFERVLSEVPPALLRDVDPAAIASYDGFERWCSTLHASGRALVLLVDEFHVLMQDDDKGEQLPVEFFNYLRSLANSYSVSIIVTSHVDLYTLSKDRKLSGSPLFNILHKLHLGPFTESEARELIEVRSTLSGRSLARDRAWLVSRGGYLPLYLQIACSIVFDWRVEHGASQPLDTVLLDQRVIDEMRPHFEGTWKLFTDAERRVLSAVVKSKPIVSDQATIVENLQQRGYLIRHDDALAVFCEPFRKFTLEMGFRTEPMRLPTGATSGLVKPHLFLSYASEDREPVDRLYERLEAAGFDPWMDNKKLVPGEVWAVSIDEAIRSTDFFLMCLSTHSVDKQGVLRQELSRGLHHWYSRKEPGIYLIPVLLEECPLPQTLQHLQKVDLWREDGWGRLLDALKKGLATRNGRFAPLPDQSSGFTAATAKVADCAKRSGSWLERRALLIGLSMMLLGILILMGGLSGEALSRLIAMVGLQRAREWQNGLRILEAMTLSIGAVLVGIVLLRRTVRPVALTGCALLVGICAFLIRVDVPAPGAFAMAYDQYLVTRTEHWQRRLLTFADRTSGGIRDGTSSGVQAWTTAQSIVALLANAKTGASIVRPQDIKSAFDYIERVRLPPPADGWTYLAEGQRSAAQHTMTEVTSWVALAEIAALSANSWDAPTRADFRRRVQRDLNSIVSRQTATGGWSPVADIRDENARTYSTVMALWALGAALEAGIRDDQYVTSAGRGMDWLLNEHQRDLGWVPNPQRRYQSEEFPGLTGQALVVLSLLEEQLDRKGDTRLKAAQERFAQMPLSRAPINANARVPDSDQHVAVDSASTIVEGRPFLWYPWSRGAFAILAADDHLSPEIRARAGREHAALTLRTEELSSYLDVAQPYELAEHLFCLGIAKTTTER